MSADYVCQIIIMSLGVCFKKLPVVKVGAFVLDTATKFALF